MSLGFVIVRHVNSPTTNEYWIEAYHRIRRVYPQNWILIVDDNSIQSLVVWNFTLRRCKVIQSEFPKAGELLGYYYFHKTKMFSQAVIMHDSVFLLQPLPKVNDPVKFLWHFENPPEKVREEKAYLSMLRHHKPLLTQYTHKKRWVGCFGVQSIIQLNFLEFLEEKYGIFELLLPFIKSRLDRQCIERVFALLCCVEYAALVRDPSVFGGIYQYPIPWGFSFQDYRTRYAVWKSLPIVKVWTGR